jgi:hypothetical protein
MTMVGAVLPLTRALVARLRLSLGYWQHLLPGLSKGHALAASPCCGEYGCLPGCERVMVMCCKRGNVRRTLACRASTAFGAVPQFWRGALLLASGVNYLASQGVWWKRVSGSEE